MGTIFFEFYIYYVARTESFFLVHGLLYLKVTSFIKVCLIWTVLAVSFFSDPCMVFQYVV